MISLVYRDFTGISGFHRYIGISPVYRDFTGISGFHRGKLPSPLAGRGWGGVIMYNNRRNQIIFIQLMGSGRWETGEDPSRPGGEKREMGL